MSDKNSHMNTRRTVLVGMTGVVGLGSIGVVSGDATGEVTSVSTPTEVDSTSEFSIDVSTRNSTATIVEVSGGSGSITLSNTDAVENTGNQIRFVDISSGDSEYVINVSVSDMGSGDELTVSTWVNDEEKSNADDVVEKTVNIAGSANASVSVSGFPETIMSDESFEFSVSTNNANRLVMDSNVELDVQDRTWNAKHIEISEVEGSYTVQGSAIELQKGDELRVDVWINGEEITDSVDSVENTVEVDGVRIKNVELSGPDEVTENAEIHTLTFTVENLTADGEQDPVSIDMPSKVEIIDVTDLSVTNIENPIVQISDDKENVSMMLNPPKTMEKDYISTDVSIGLELKTQ